MTQVFIVAFIVGALLFLWLKLLLKLAYFLLGVIETIKEAKLVLLLE